MAYFNKETETLQRDELDALVDERIRYTVKYAQDNSPFYRKWFFDNNIKAPKLDHMKIYWNYQ